MRSNKPYTNTTFTHHDQRHEQVFARHVFYSRSELRLTSQLVCRPDGQARDWQTFPKTGGAAVSDGFLSTLVGGFFAGRGSDPRTRPRTVRGSDPRTRQLTI